METRFKLLGHHVHPMLIVFPLRRDGIAFLPNLVPLILGLVGATLALFLA